MTDREFEVTGVPSEPSRVSVTGGRLRDVTPEQDEKYTQYQTNLKNVMEAQDNNWLTRTMRAARNRGLPGPAPVPTLPTPRLNAGEGIQTPLGDLTRYDADRHRTDLRNFEVFAELVNGPGAVTDNKLAARQVHALVQEFPELRSLVDEDFELLLGLSDPEIMRAAQDSMTGRLFSTTVEMMDEYLARNRSTWGLRTSEEVVKLGGFSSSQPLIGDDGLAYYEQRLREVAERTVATGGTQERWDRVATITNSIKRGIYIPEVFGGQNRTTEVFFTPGVNRLTAIVTYEDDSTGFIDVELDGDTVNPDNPYHSAIWELMLAEAGLAHSVVGKENLKGRQNWMGSALQKMDVVGDNWDRINGPLNGLVGNLERGALSLTVPTATFEVDWRSSEQRYLEERQRDAYELADQLVSSVGEGEIILAMAQQHMVLEGTSSLVESAGAVLPAWDTASPEQQEAIKNDLFDMEQLTEVMLDATDDRNSFKRAIDETLMSVSAPLMWYDQHLQYFGTLNLGNLQALIGAAVDLVPGDFVTGEDFDEWLGLQDLGEGVNRWQAMWDEVHENPRVADYLGVEGSARGYVDFIASVGLDPLTFVTPGGKGLLQNFSRRIATREGAEQMARSPVRKWRIAQAADAFDAGDYRKLWSMTHMGVDDEIMYGLLSGKITADDAYQAFDEAFRRSHPTAGGLGLDSLDGVMVRNHAEQLASISKSWDLLPDQMRDKMVMKLGYFPAERTIGLSGLNWSDQTGQFLMSASVLPGVTDDMLGGWFEEMYRLGSEIYQPRTSSRSFVSDRLTQLRQARDDLIGTTPQEVRTFTNRIGNAKQKVRTYRRQLDAGKDVTDRLRSAEEQLAKLEELRPDYDDFKVRHTELEQQISRDSALSYQVAAGAPLLRARQGEFLSKVMNQIADNLEYVDDANKVQVGLPKLTNADGSAILDVYGQARRNWDIITGEERFVGRRTITAGQYDQAASNLRVASTGVAGVDAELAKALADTSFDQATMYRLPVSPRMLIAYSNFTNKRAWKRDVLRRLRRSRLQDGFNGLQRVWASSVLFNASTFLKSNFEEMFRVGGERGILGSLGARAVDISGNYGDELVYARTPSTLGAGVRQFGGPSGVDNTLSASAGAEFRSPMPDKVSLAGYELVQPSNRSSFRKAQQFWYDGILQSDEVSRKAWAVADFDGFTDEFSVWWNQTGKIQYSKTGTLNTQSGVMSGAITATEAWQSRQNLLDLILEYVSPSRKDRVAAAFRKAAKDGTNLPDDIKRMIRQPLPGRADSAESAFDFMFKPYAYASGRRNSLVHQEFMADALEGMWTAHSDAGTLLTYQRLAELSGVDLATATNWLDNATWEVEEIMRHYGMVTPRMIYDKAGRWAKYRTDSLMYQAGAASISGKLAQRVYPFGPAQLDFLSYNYKRMRSQLELGLNPKIQKALKMIPGINSNIDNIPFVGHSVQPSIAGSRIPFNLRLAARIGEVGGWASYYAQDYYKQNPDANRVEGGLLGFLGDATFYPLEPQSWSMQLGFGPGPLPAFAVHLLPDSEDIGDDAGPWTKAAAGGRDLIEALHPTLEFDQNTYSLQEASSWMSLLQDFAPMSKRSPLRVGNDLLRRLSVYLTDDEEGAERVYDLNQTTLERFGRPPGYNALIKSKLAAELNERGLIEAGSTDMWDILSAASTEALTETSTETLQATGNAAALGLGIWSVETFNGEILEPYEGFVDNLDTYESLGAVGSAQAAQLRDWWEAANAPGADADTRRKFTDQAFSQMLGLADFPLLTDETGEPLTTLVNVGGNTYEERLVPQATHLDLLLVTNPGAAMNLTSQYRCKLDPGGSPVDPEGWCSLDGSLELPSGPEGRRIFQKGNGKWIEPRTDREILEAANSRIARAKTRVATALWVGLTGETRFPGSPSSSSYPKRLRDDVTRKIDLNESQAGLFTDLRRGMGEVVQVRPGQVSVEELAEVIHGIKQFATTKLADFNPRIDQGFNVMLGNARNDLDKQYIAEFRQIEGDFRKGLQDQGLSFGDLGPGEQDAVRDIFRNAVNVRGVLPEKDYSSFFASYYGDLDWVFEPPPAIGQVEFSMSLGSNFSVVDGDTVKVFPEDGTPYRVRLVGVNAVDFNELNPVANQQAFEQRERLVDLIGDGQGVQFGMWKPEQFGTFQEIDPKTGERRFLLWLYKDGKPVFDEAVFSESNPGGVSSTGNGVPVSYLQSEGEAS